MPTITYSDLESYRRCPYAFKLDSTDAFPDKIALQECLDHAVKDTIYGFSRSRILGERMKEDKVLESFWKNWDAHFPKVYNPLREDSMQYIRIGEKCIRNFVYQSTRFGSIDIVASRMEGTLSLPGGKEISIAIDEVGRRGTTAYLTRYITDTEILSKEQLSSDIGMKVSALWAMDNIGAREIVMRWVFLVPSTSTELTAYRNNCEEAARLVSSMIDEMQSKDPLPRESDYCDSCPYQSRCPRFLHELSVKEKGPDEGSELADKYLDLENKKQALKNRIELLEAEQDALKARIVAYSDSKGYMSLKGSDGKILIRHERKAELPQDKTKIIERLKDTGEYESVSMPNYSRLRADIVKGTADPVIIAMANISKVDKIYVKKKDE